MIRILATAVLFLCTLAFVNNTFADVSIVDSDVRAGGNSTETIFDVGTGGLTGNDRAQDYVLVMCSTLSDGTNNFLTPTPGAWTQVDNGDCGNGGFAPGISCIQSVWGMFTETSQIQDVSCNWTQETFVYNAGSFRFRNVDLNNPIIASECDNGFGATAVAPSIQSEAGAQVVRIATFRFPEGILCGDNQNRFTENNLSSISACSNEDVLNISLAAETQFDGTGGPTGEADIPVDGNISSNANWRACTVSLRMLTRPVPTMSEWGFIAVAAFMGIAGIWYLRRRQVKA